MFSESDTPLWLLLKNVWNVPYEEIGTYCGIEGQLYLALHLAMGGGLFILAILGTTVLIPIYAIGQSSVNKDMNNLSVAHIIDDEDLMSVVLVLFIIFTLVIMGSIVSYIYQVSDAYAQPSELICTIDKYTVEIKGIPHHFAPAEAAIKIRDLLQITYSYDIKTVYVVPNLAEASRIQKEIDETKKNLKHYKDFEFVKGHKDRIREPWYSKVDAIDYYTEKLDKLNQEYKTEIENGYNTTSGFAFVLCRSPICAFRLAQSWVGRDDDLKSNK